MAGASGHPAVQRLHWKQALGETVRRWARKERSPAMTGCANELSLLSGPISPAVPAHPGFRVKQLPRSKVNLINYSMGCPPCQEFSRD